MARKKKAAYDEEKVLELVAPKVAKCVSWYDSRLSKERQNVLDYYEGRYPVRQSNGHSSYVSSDVYDAVESMHAQLVETFGGVHHNALRFKPKGVEDAPLARIATKYVDHVIFEQNDGFGLISDVLQDGLMSRNAIARCYWEEKYVYDETKFKGKTFDEVQALLAQEDIEEFEAELEDDDYDTPETATYSGKFCRKIDKSGVVVEPVAPDEFYIEGRVKKRTDGTRGIKTRKTKAELVEMDFDTAKIDQAFTTGEAGEQTLTADHEARFESTSDTTDLGSKSDQPEMDQVELYTTYTKMVLESDKKARLYRVIHAGQVVFDICEVDEDEFVECRLLRRAHVWYGNNFAQRTIQTQNARTVLTRAILDHTAITTNPRWQVLKGALTNPREMLDNRQGGLVNVNRQDGLTPLQYPNMNPFAFETLKMLKENKEETTGISALSQGMNKEAISTQNSEGLVDNLVSLSQVRQRVMARNFARGFLTELYMKVYRLVVENEKAKKIFEVAGEFVEVQPKDWISQRDVVLSLHLGYGEQEKEGNNLIAAYSLINQDPILAQFFTPPKRHKMATDALVAKGIYQFADYLEDAAYQPPPPPPDPEAVAKQAQAEAAKTNADANMLKAEVAKMQATFKAMMDQMAHELKTAIATRDADRKDLDVVNRAEVSQREMDLAESVPPEGQRGIFSPNS